MAAKGQIEIRVKFTGVPLAAHDSRGFTKLEVFCDGYVVLANVKTKTYQRFLSSMRDYVDGWEGAISGKLHHIQGHQLVLSNAGLQCYEKKPKATSSSEAWH